MPSFISLRWAPLQALDAEWELCVWNAVHALQMDQVVSMLRPEASELPDLAIFAYPASAHRAIAKGSALSDALALFPGIDTRRVAVTALAESSPPITFPQVQKIVTEQAAGPGERYPARCETPDDLVAQIVKWLTLVGRPLNLVAATGPRPYSVDSVMSGSQEMKPWDVL
ncbi:MAG: hypothetical protein ABI566_03340 [Pseudolysinimonas sp.]